MHALYSLYDALRDIDVPPDKAKAVVSALEQEMSSILATKSDLQNIQLLLRQEVCAARDALKQELASLDKKIDSTRELLEQKLTHGLDELRSSMIIKLGSLYFVGMGMLFAALKLT